MRSGCKAKTTHQAVCREMGATDRCQNVVARPHYVAVWTGRPVGTGVPWDKGG